MTTNKELIKWYSSANFNKQADGILKSLGVTTITQKDLENAESICAHVQRLYDDYRKSFTEISSV